MLEGKSMAIVSVGIDLKKERFAVHGVDESSKPALVRPNLASTFDWYVCRG